MRKLTPLVAQLSQLLQSMPAAATCCSAQSAVAEQAYFRHLLFSSVTCRGVCHITCATCCSASTAHAPAGATCCSAQSAVAEHALSPPSCCAACCSTFTEHVTQTPRAAQLSQSMRLVHYAACELRSHCAGVLSSVWPQSSSLLEQRQSRPFVNFNTF